MKDDKTNEKYNEVLKDIKSEKMNWNFNEFLAKAENEEKTIPMISGNKNRFFPKTYWMAASLVLLVSMGFFYKFLNNNSIDEQDNLVKNEILRQKEIFDNDNQLAINEINDSLKIKSDSVISDSASTVEQSRETDIIDQILPKRSRLKRQVNPRYVQNQNTKKSATDKTNYEANYVIINGQKITNEQEAIDLTKYSFRILSENISKTVAQTEKMNNFSIDE